MPRRRFASVVAAAIVTWTATASADPVVGPPTKDAFGVLHYPVTSSFQGAAPNDLRVLLPASPGVGQRRFLYVLPVEVGVQSAYGDPVDVVRLLGVVDALHLVLVVPAFSQTPWYGDHATDSTVRQESYLVDDIVPAVEKLYPETPGNLGPPRRLLLGFSKSGNGAFSLILRHSTTFDAAAAWDAPLAQTDVNNLPGAAPIFGTQANYTLYSVPLLFPAHAPEFKGSTRLWLGGFSGWHADMIKAHDQLVSLGVPHAWVDGPMVAHHWNSGWVPSAIAFLDQAAPAMTFGSGGSGGGGGSGGSGAGAAGKGGSAGGAAGASGSTVTGGSSGTSGASGASGGGGAAAGGGAAGVAGTSGQGGGAGAGPTGGGAGKGGGAQTGGSAGSLGSAGKSGSAGASSGGSGAAAGDTGEGDSGGCSCAAPASSADTVSWLVALAVAGALRRGRQRKP